MATYSFPALGFDPAPGDPDAVESLARDCARAARELEDGAAQLDAVGDPGIWEGEAADGFRARTKQVRSDLGASGGACGAAGSALLRFADVLREAQLQARRAEDEAADAKARVQHFSAEIERLSGAVWTAAVDPGAAAMADELEASRRHQGWAEEEYQAALARARRVQEWLEEAGDLAARAIRGIEAPYHPPRRGLFQQAAGWVGDRVEDVASAADRFVDEHADVLRGISGALKAVSAAAGLLSFVPVLTPIMAPIATGTAVAALGLDTTLVATGHGDWKQVGVDGALMALPVAGKLASRTVMGRQAARVATERADAVQALNLPNRTRPGTVAALKTRNPGVNVFKGATKGPSIELHPRVQQALQRVPAGKRSAYHGKCAEIRAIDDALKRGARLKDSVIQTRFVRRIGDPKHALPHVPCDSCKAVLRQLKIKYME